MLQIILKRFPLLFLLFTRPLVCSETEDPGIADVLFHHVLNGNTIELFPGLPELPLPVGLTVHMVMLSLVTLLIMFLFIPTFRKPQIKVRGIGSALELLVLFVRDDIVYPIMGEERGIKWLPFFATLFLFVLFTNYLGLIPAFKTATGNINVSTALALMIMVLIFIIGLKNLGPIGFFKNMYPEGAPVAIGIFVLILELFSTVIKSMVLSLRIFANMFAGHLAILSFLVLIFVLSPFFAAVSVPFALFIYLLEVLVALIQAMVFTLLSCIFITMASSHH